MRNLYNYKCLVLNADYLPIKIVDWKKSVVWGLYDSVYSGVQVLEYHKDIYIIGSGNKNYFLPSVVKNIEWYNIYTQPLKLCSKNLFIRDNYTCQYCGKKLLSHQLTKDHIIPKSRLKKLTNKKTWNSWDNLTTSCSLCNRKKGNRTPDEANMKLRSSPKTPNKTYIDILSSVITHRMDNIPQEWRTYIKNYE
jgi:5-methylcytosine-specific restriction endonuclease McrA